MVGTQMPSDLPRMVSFIVAELPEADRERLDICGRPGAHERHDER